MDLAHTSVPADVYWAWTRSKSTQVSFVSLASPGPKMACVCAASPCSGEPSFMGSQLALTTMSPDVSTVVATGSTWGRPFVCFSERRVGQTHPAHREEATVGRERRLIGLAAAEDERIGRRTDASGTAATLLDLGPRERAVGVIASEVRPDARPRVASPSSRRRPPAGAAARPRGERQQHPTDAQSMRAPMA
jgi:hypothetical protein